MHIQRNDSHRDRTRRTAAKVAACALRNARKGKRAVQFLAFADGPALAFEGAR